MAAPAATISAPIEPQQHEGIQLIQHDTKPQAETVLATNESTDCQSTRCRMIFHPLFVFIAFMFIPVISVSIVLLLIKFNEECGMHCILIWSKGGKAIIPKLVILAVDIIFVAVGVCYNTPGPHCCCDCASSPKYRELPPDETTEGQM